MTSEALIYETSREATLAFVRLSKTLCQRYLPEENMDTLEQLVDTITIAADKILLSEPYGMEQSVSEILVAMAKVCDRFGLSWKHIVGEIYSIVKTTGSAGVC